MNSFDPICTDIERVPPGARAAVAGRAYRRVRPLRFLGPGQDMESTSPMVRQAERVLASVVPEAVSPQPRPVAGRQPVPQIADRVLQAAVAAACLAVPDHEARFPNPAPTYGTPKLLSPKSAVEELQALYFATMSAVRPVAGQTAVDAALLALTADVAAAVAGASFGPLWDDALAAKVAAVADAEKWLYEQIGDFTPRPVLTWEFKDNDGDSFPDGVEVTVAVPEWGLSSGRPFKWDEIEDANYFRGELSSRWGKVLGQYQRAMLKKAAETEGD